MMNARLVLILLVASALFACGCSKASKRSFANPDLQYGFNPPDAWVHSTQGKVTTFRLAEGTAFKSRLEVEYFSDQRFERSDFEGWAEGFRISMKRNGREPDKFEVKPRAGYFEAEFTNPDGETVVRRTRHTNGNTIHLSAITPPAERDRFRDIFRESLDSFITW
jgi:hypothetical protein